MLKHSVACMPLHVAQNFGTRVKGSVDTWKDQMLRELDAVATDAGEQPLLIKLTAHLQERACVFFESPVSALASNLTISGISKSVHGVPAGQPVMLLVLMCPNKMECCADR